MQLRRREKRLQDIWVNFSSFHVGSYEGEKTITPNPKNWIFSYNNLKFQQAWLLCKFEGLPPASNLQEYDRYLTLHSQHVEVMAKETAVCANM